MPARRLTLVPTLANRLALLAAALIAFAAPPAVAAEDFSPSERALFIDNHLAAVKPPAELRYRYEKAGSLEAGFEDDVTVRVKKNAAGACCDADAEFLTGARRMPLPAVEGVQGNPVLLYFLERDIREMSRLTKGQAAYFRKRIRMAVYQGAEIKDTTIQYNGREVPARRITIAPYADDPMRPRFEQLAVKRYTFVLSPAVPGQIALLRARADAAEPGKPPVLVEQLTLAGVRVPADL